MDLRVKKTKQSIREAFIKLRAQKPLEKITVKELCEASLINKATFYLHYRDIYDLSETLENELIEDCILAIPENDFLSVEKVILEFAKMFSSQNGQFAILFSGNRLNRAVSIIDLYVKERCYKIHPQLKDDLSFNIRLTANTYGIFHAFSIYKDKNLDEVLSSLVSFSEEIFNF